MKRFLGCLVTAIGVIGAIVGILAAFKIGPFEEPAPPMLSVSPRELTISSDSPGELRIRNIGKQTLQWRVDSSPSWTSVDRSQGGLGDGSSTLLYVSTRGDLDEVHSGMIEIASNGGNISVSITGQPRGDLPVDLTVDATVDPNPGVNTADEYAIYYFGQRYNFLIEVTNHGPGFITGDVEVDFVIECPDCPVPVDETRRVQLPGPIAPGTTARASEEIDFQIHGGFYRLIFTVDPRNKIPESNEGNNDRISVRSRVE